MNATLDHGSALPSIDLSVPRSRRLVIGYWIATALLCLQMGFTAYAQLTLPQVAEMFAHLGFPDYFRVQLSLAKLLGIALLVAPVPARLREWAYAGFAITLASALIAHLSVGDGPEAWSWSVGTGVLWGFSYVLWRKNLSGTGIREPGAAERGGAVTGENGTRDRRRTRSAAM